MHQKPLVFNLINADFSNWANFWPTKNRRKKLLYTIADLRPNHLYRQCQYKHIDFSGCLAPSIEFCTFYAFVLITTNQSRWDYQSSKLGQTYYLSFSYVYSNSLYIFCGCFSEFWDFCCNTVTHMGWSYTNWIYVFVQYFEDKYPQKIEVVCYKDFRGTKIRFSTTCTKWRFFSIMTQGFNYLW